MKSLSETTTFCFRSKTLVEMENVPHILSVEVELNGDFGCLFVDWMLRKFHQPIFFKKKILILIHVVYLNDIKIYVIYLNDVNRFTSFLQ